MHIAKWMVNSMTVTNAQLQKKIKFNKDSYLASVLDSQMLSTNKIKEPPIFLSKNKFRTSKLLSTSNVCLFPLVCTNLNLWLYFTKNIMKRAKLFDFTVANNIHLWINLEESDLSCLKAKKNAGSYSKFLLYRCTFGLNKGSKHIKILLFFHILSTLLTFQCYWIRKWSLI